MYLYKKLIDYFYILFYNILNASLLKKIGEIMETDINTVISKVIQLLLILVVGIYTRKRGFINRETVKSLSQYLSHVTNPLLIICSFQVEYSSQLLKTGMIILAGSFIIHIVSSIIAYFVFPPKKGSCVNAVYEFTTVFANCSFMGFPILMAIYGEKLGVMYGSFYNAVFNIFFWTYGIVILTRHKTKEDGKKNVNMKNLFLNPGVVATVVGFVLFVTGIKIPEVLLGGMKMVGDSTFPIAMIIIGALIVELDLKTAFNDLKLYICAALKLIIIPFAVLFCCVLIKAPAIVTNVLVVLSGMPAATFGAIFAEIYGTNPVTSAKIVCITTILSLATIPFFCVFQTCLFD